MERTTQLRIRGGKPLRGDVRAPADLEIAQHLLLFAALSDGRCELLDAPEADTLEFAARAWRALGVRIERDPRALVVHGAGLHGLAMPSGSLECGRSLTLLAQLAAVLSGQRFGTRLTLHPSLAARSVEHIVGPLRARGAHVAGHSDAGTVTAPIAVAPLVDGELLAGLDATLPLADNVAKNAALISGLFAAGNTTVSEPSVSADHVERLMVGLGLPLRRVGSVVAFEAGAWQRRIAAFRRVSLAGDVTLASYLAVAAQLLPGSDITLRGVGINPTRSGALEMLAQWSRALTVVPTGDAALREPIADVRVVTAAQRGGAVGGELLLRAPAELPALALLGSVAPRGVQLYDLDALPPGSQTEAQTLDALLGAFGVALERRANALHVTCAPLHAAEVDACDDPRLALCACTLGLACAGQTVVKHAAQALSAVYPGWIETVRALGAQIELA